MQHRIQNFVKKIRRKPEYVINFMKFIAQELREYMAKLGVATVDELVGRTDLLKPNEKAAEKTCRSFKDSWI